MRFFYLTIGAFGATSLLFTVQRQIGAPYWSYFALAIVAAFVTYQINVALIKGYIVRHEGHLDTTEVEPGVQAWELTAGTGAVPRWVSRLGMVSPCFLLAIPLELLRWFLDAYGLI